MYPIGMERFYGGLKLAFTKGGIPVPFEWTVGKTVEECVRVMCANAARDLIVWKSGRSYDKLVIMPCRVTDIRQIVRRKVTVGGDAIYHDKPVNVVEVSLKILGQEDDSCGICADLEDLYISRQALVRGMIETTLEDLTSFKKKVLDINTDKKGFQLAVKKFNEKLEMARNDMQELEKLLEQPETTQQENNHDRSDPETVQ